MYQVIMVLDWPAVKADGIEFAMLRIGYRGAQNGILHEDEYIDANMEQAIQNHLRVGVYFFSSATSSKEIDEEVDLVLNKILADRPNRMVERTCHRPPRQGISESDTTGVSGDV